MVLSIRYIILLLVYVIIIALLIHYRMIQIPIIRHFKESYVTCCHKNVTSNNKKNVVVVRDVKTTDETVKPKVLLLYSSLHEKRYWFGVEPYDLTMMTRLPDCQYSCDVTYDRHDILNADAALFHGPDVWYSTFYYNSIQLSPDVLRNVSKLRKQGQKWIFFSHESPHYYHGFHDYYNLFDWTMSYRYTSDIFVPLTGFYRTLGSQDYVPSTYINYAKGKTRLGIWMANNCKLPRDKYIEELRKYIPITVGGKCSKRRFNETIMCKYGSEECTKLIKSHKFFFAFENSFCDFYVSEKYWSKGIDMGLVPVVMGARYDQYTSIPGSYIDVFDFPSIESLANHLKTLDANDEEYNKYFDWKKLYKSSPLPSISSFPLCEACKALWLNQTSRPYIDVWSKRQDCDPFDWKPRLIEKLALDSARNRKIKYLAAKNKTLV